MVRVVVELTNTQREFANNRLFFFFPRSNAAFMQAAFKNVIGGLPPSFGAFSSSVDGRQLLEVRVPSSILALVIMALPRHSIYSSSRMTNDAALHPRVTSSVIIRLPSFLFGMGEEGGENSQEATRLGSDQEAFIVVIPCSRFLYKIIIVINCNQTKAR